MRIEVKKFLFIGLNKKKDLFFEEAQSFGKVQFIEQSGPIATYTPRPIERTVQAIKILRSLSTVDQIDPHNFEDAETTVDRILSLRSEQRKLEDEQRENRLEMARLAPYGDFSLEDIAFIEKNGNRQVQFFCAREGKRHDDLPESLIYVGNDLGLDYFVSIHHEKQYHPKMVELHFSHNLSSLTQRNQEIKKKLWQIEAELKKLAKYNTYLHQYLVILSNKFQLKTAKGLPEDLLGDHLFVVSGWVPVDQVAKLDQIAKDSDVHHEEVAIEQNDVIPTHLENKGFGKVGEDLVHIYDTPSHTDDDPSLWVLGAFSLFFAIIVGDGGYGFIYLAAALYFWFKVPKLKGGMLRFRKLIFILCGCCIAWGVLTHSFFGIGIPIDSPIRKVSLLNYLTEKKAEFHARYQDETFQEWNNQYPALQPNMSGKDLLKTASKEKNGDLWFEMDESFSRTILLEIALVIGLIHIAISFIRYLPRNYSHIGWLAVLLGAYLYFPHYLGATSLLHYALGIPPEVGASEGIYLMGGGLTVALLIGIITSGIAGLLELVNVIQVFADVMSYLRLYALGLASAIVSQTINDMAAAVPFVIAIILLIISHAVNMALGIVGGVIHGLRLNFLEWYHYSFEGGGKLFRPLKLEKID